MVQSLAPDWKNLIPPTPHCCRNYEYKHAFTCITIEQYSRKVTRRLLGFVDIKSLVVSVAISKVGSRIEDVPELACLAVESNEILAGSLPELLCDVTTPDE